MRKLGRDTAPLSRALLIVLFSATALFAPALAQSKSAVWHSNERRATLTVQRPHGLVTLGVTCEPSGSGGRTIPSVILAVPLERVALGGLQARSKSEMRVSFTGGYPANLDSVAYLLNQSTFEIRGGGQGPRIEFAGYAGWNDADPSALAILSSLSMAETALVSVRIDGGPWVTEEFPVEGASTALAKTWCGNGLTRG